MSAEAAAAAIPASRSAASGRSTRPATARAGIPCRPPGRPGRSGSCPRATAHPWSRRRRRRDRPGEVPVEADQVGQQVEFRHEHRAGGGVQAAGAAARRAAPLQRRSIPAGGRPEDSGQPREPLLEGRNRDGARPLLRREDRGGTGRPEQRVRTSQHRVTDVCAGRSSSRVRSRHSRASAQGISSPVPSVPAARADRGGPCTSAVCRRPPAARTAATVPSPPSATGSSRTSADGRARRTPDANAAAASGAVRVALNLSGRPGRARGQPRSSPTRTTTSRMRARSASPSGCRGGRTCASSIRPSSARATFIRLCPSRNGSS
jgi:hypothetical protein